MCRGWTQTDYQNKHYNINQRDEGTWDDRGRDGGTNFILRIKEQETRLTLQEHDDDDEVTIVLPSPATCALVSQILDAQPFAVYSFLVTRCAINGIPIKQSLIFSPVSATVFLAFQ